MLSPLLESFILDHNISSQILSLKAIQKTGTENEHPRIIRITFRKGCHTIKAALLRSKCQKFSVCLPARYQHKDALNAIWERQRLVREGLYSIQIWLIYVSQCGII